MAYFITGGTGFIGGHLLQRLANRKGTIYMLVRHGSEHKVDVLRRSLRLDRSRLVAVKGDLDQPNLGISAANMAKLKGKVRNFFHLAAVYDMKDEDAEQQFKSNVEGTRHAIQCAEKIQAKCFHHVSSIAVAGMYQGFWREDMFEEAHKSNDLYFRTKREAEAVVRSECKVPYRIFRPGIVVGHSVTGEMDKIDGPYYLFKFIQRMRNIFPSWFPMIGVEGGRLNIVPVDFVASAMDHIAHKKGLNGRCFHLTDPEPFRAGEVLNIFARSAHAPQFVMRIDYRLMSLIPQPIRDAIFQLPPVRHIIDGVLNDFGVPKNILTFIDYPTRFDCRDTVAELKGTKIQCPSLKDYAHVLWDYWERNLDPDLFRDHTLAGAVKGRVVLITGASSGIGHAAAIRIARAGAETLLVARGKEKLEETRAEIIAQGGKAYVYPTDLSDAESCEKLIKRVLKSHGRIDILVNNAGRSIRRAIHNSYDRIHDFERTMQLNYIAAVRLMLGVLPGMEANQFGHIVNVSSIGVLANSPRFSAYVASKSALDAFSRCAAPEYLDKNVRFTTINMPLVRTPMIGPTSFYKNVPALSVDEAADMVCEAIIERPKRIATRLGIFAQVLTTLMPNVADVVLNTAYKLFPESSAAMGDEKGPEQEASAEAVAFAALMRGVHW